MSDPRADHPSSSAAPSDSRPRRTLSVEEAIALVVECLQEGRVRDAEGLCRRVLEVVPAHPDALHYAGVSAYKQGRTGEGIALVRQSLAQVPEQADWHSNLGIMLQAQDELDGAVAAFERAIALQPSHANALSNLGVLCRAFGRYEEAEAHYRRTIELQPDHAGAYHNLAILLDLTNRPAEAVAAYNKALTLQPQLPEARRLLALAYCMLGDRDKAIQVCESWLAHEPDNPQARHTLAACSGRDVPPRAADAYVQHIFDRFAESFEAKPARLSYRAPALVADALAAAGAGPAGALDVLDLGCGTGLCGPLLKPLARRLVGVDLSSGMLEHAASKEVYDDLVQAELTAYLQQVREPFDVIVSADTLVYFGALEEVVAAAARVLRPGGLFVFTLEEAAVADGVDGEDRPPFAIQPHGRYVHRPDYVERLLQEAGLVVTIGRAELRKESGLPVAGLVVRAQRPAAAEDGGDGRGDMSRRSGADDA